MSQVLDYIPITGLENTSEYEKYLEEIRQTTIRNIAILKRNITSVKRRIGVLIRYYKLDVPEKNLPGLAANFNSEELTDRSNIYSGLLNLVLSFDNLIEKTQGVENDMVFCSLANDFDKLYEQLIEFDNWLMKFEISSGEMEEEEELEEYEEYCLDSNQA